MATEERLKLLIATDCFPPRKDGIARFLEEILPFMKKDFDITVIAPEYVGTMKRDFSKELDLIRFPLSDKKYGDYQPAKTDYSRIKDAVSKTDIIWSQTLGPIGARTIWAAGHYRKPVVAYIHSMENELVTRSVALRGIVSNMIDRIAKSFMRFFYNRCYLLMVPFKDASDKLDGLGIKTDKAIVHMAVNEDQFKPSDDKDTSKAKIGIPKNRFVIGYVGRIAKEKDLETLYRAFTHIKERRKDLFLLIVGDGPAEQKMMFKGDDVRITGSIDNVIPCLQAMDVFVLPSLTETSSLSTMEAMSTSIPVIVTPVGFMKTYVENGYNGFIIPKRGIEDLANKIEELMDDSVLRTRIGKNARKTINKTYVWNKTSKEIIRLLKKIRRETSEN